MNIYLFVSHFKLDTDVNESKKLIEAFRKLEKKQQHNLVKSAEINTTYKNTGFYNITTFWLNTNFEI